METSKACNFGDGERTPDREMTAAGENPNADGKALETFAFGPAPQRCFIEL
jgi:hypothetical protein